MCCRVHGFVRTGDESPHAALQRQAERIGFLRELDPGAEVRAGRAAAMEGFRETGRPRLFAKSGLNGVNNAAMVHLEQAAAETGSEADLTALQVLAKGKRDEGARAFAQAVRRARAR